MGFHRMEATHLATPGHAHILSDRDRGCGHSPSTTTAYIESFSPVPAVEFSGTAYAVSSPLSSFCPCQKPLSGEASGKWNAYLPVLELEGSLAAITSVMPLLLSLAAPLAPCSCT